MRGRRELSISVTDLTYSAVSFSVTVSWKQRFNVIRDKKTVWNMQHSISGQDIWLDHIRIFIQINLAL